MKGMNTFSMETTKILLETELAIAFKLCMSTSSAITAKINVECSIKMMPEQTAVADLPLADNMFFYCVWRLD